MENYKRISSAKYGSRLIVSDGSNRFDVPVWRKLWIVQKATEIIRNNIQSKVSKNKEYPSSDYFFIDAESLLTFLKSLMINKTKRTQETKRRLCYGLSRHNLSNETPYFYFFSIEWLKTINRSFIKHGVLRIIPRSTKVGHVCSSKCSTKCQAELIYSICVWQRRLYCVPHLPLMCNCQDQASLDWLRFLHVPGDWKTRNYSTWTQESRIAVCYCARNDDPIWTYSSSFLWNSMAHC